MTNKVLGILLGIGLLLGTASRAIAVIDPLLVPNNKIGIHVLDPMEVITASKLVNGESGSWGYVTVPIQATDRDRDKWILFMKQAREAKVIPIIRVATLVNSVHWEEPNNYDLVDFANFLNDLPWPTKNRYVVIFNEVNRADEYGGFVSPERYAEILTNAITIFKERNEDFFIMPAGLDNAAASNGSSLQWKEYWRRVFTHRPEIAERIDGWVSHSYPNYAFSGSPYDRHDHSVYGFVHELNFLSKYTGRELPVFITETGWEMKGISPDKAASNLKIAYETVWNDRRVTAVTPFLLQAGEGPFTGFSFLDLNASPKPVYRVWQAMATKGEPVLNTAESPLLKFGGSGNPLSPTAESINERLQVVDWGSVWRWLNRVFGLYKLRVNLENEIKVGEHRYQIEVVDTEQERVDGLSGRARLHDDEGMLFVFEEKEKRVFWMKGMKFDIDIVWITDGKVVGIDRADYLHPYKRYYSPIPVEKVLEVTADSGIKVGDVVEYGLEK